MTGDAPFSEATKVDCVVVTFLREIGYDERKEEKPERERERKKIGNVCLMREEREV